MGDALNSERDKEEACDGKEDVANVEGAPDTGEALGKEQEHEGRDADGKAEEEHNRTLGGGVEGARTVEDAEFVRVCATARATKAPVLATACMTVVRLCRECMRSNNWRGKKMREHETNSTCRC